MKRKVSIQAGFGMMEILAAMAIMAVGVLGFAAIQVRAVQASGGSYYRSQAMEIAQDAAERMLVNSAEIANYKLVANWPDTFPPAVVSSPSTSCTGVSNRTAAQLRACDIQDIQYNAQALLPAGMVRIEKCQGLAAGSAIDCIYVSWNGTLPRVRPSATVDKSCVLSTGVYVVDADCIMLEMQ